MVFTMALLHLQAFMIYIFPVQDLCDKYQESQHMLHKEPGFPELTSVWMTTSFSEKGTRSDPPE